MPRPKISNQMTTAQAARHLEMSPSKLISWIEHGALPPPSFIDKNRVRYFDQEWIRRAKQILRNKLGRQNKKRPAPTGLF